MNMQELNSESYNQKILLKKSAKMDLIFDQLPYPHKAVRNPTDHRHIGMTTYYGMKFKNSKIQKVCTSFRVCIGILYHSFNQNVNNWSNFYSF